MSRCRLLVHFCAILVVGLSLSGCQYPSEEGEGPGHREQQLALSPQQELQLGRQTYQEVLNNPEKYGKVLPTASSQTQRVRNVASRIIKASEIEPLEREMNLLNFRKGYRFEWEVNVFENRQANAFCLPGGKIAVFTGILRTAEDDGELATVLGHEIAHALAHHTSERVARDQMNGGGGGIWDKAFDRSQESEADHIGLFLMTFAGYDPEDAVRFWERMEQFSAGRRAPPEFLSDHPSDAHRIAQLKQWVPKARAAKKAYDEGDIAPAPSR